MKRLSRLRRHRAAGPILLVFALFTIGTTFQVAGAATTSPMTAEERTAAIAEGKEIFLKTRIPAFLFDMEFLVLASKRSDIRIQWIYVQAREGIVFSTMRAKTILTELINFTKILFRLDK